MNRKRRYIIIVFSGIILYLALLTVLICVEKRAGNHSIDDLFDAVWYSFVTFSTVGYGDVFPVSVIGKIIGLLFILFSIGFIGVIIGNITNIFQKRMEKRRFGLMGTDFQNHVIVIGWDEFAESVATQLINADRKVAVLTNNKDHIDLIFQYFSHDDMYVCFSDISKYGTLKLLNAEKASVIFLNNGSDSDKLISIINIKKLYPRIEFVVILDNSELKDTFMSAGVTYVLSKNEIASKLLASYIFEPAVANYTNELMSSTKDEANYDIQQYKVKEKNPYLNYPYGKMFHELKEKYNIIAIGLNKNKQGKGRLIKAPDDHETVEKDDDIIVIANGATEQILQNIFNVKEGTRLNI